MTARELLDDALEYAYHDRQCTHDCTGKCNCGYDEFFQRVQKFLAEEERDDATTNQTEDQAETSETPAD